MLGKTTRTRFAPSPTGPLHVGGARTALFNWLFTARNSGIFVLRIDDTDPERSEERYVNGIIEDLKWLGLTWDEGPDVGGDLGPYTQSERLGLYRSHADRLVGEGKAYKCYCSKERLAELKASQAASGKPPRYDRRCLGLAPGDAPGDVAPVIRFKVPDGTIAFKDIARGLVSFKGSDIGDFIILASDGVATYNFATAIDDASMDITDVIRGDDHISNTPRQTLIIDALGFKAPRYMHLPLIVDADKKPLSKRDESLSISALRDEGYFSMSVINALARLGWSPAEGILTLQNMILTFQAERISKSPALFDIGRLKRYEKELLKDMEPDEIIDVLSKRTCTKDIDEDWLFSLITEVKADLDSVSDIRKLVDVLLCEITPDESAKEHLKSRKDIGILKAFLRELEGARELTAESFEDMIRRMKFALGDPKKVIFMPIRAALTGSISGVEMSKVANYLDKEKAVKRVKKVLEGS